MSSARRPFAKRLDRLDRRLTRLERDVGIDVEMIALFVRFWLSNTPPPPEAERDAMRRLGNDRYDAFMTALGHRLAKGPKVRQEIGEDFPSPETAEPPTPLPVFLRQTTTPAFTC